MALYQLLTRNFTSRGKQQVNILAAVVALSLNVGLNLFLIPRYGISGAALANGLSYGTAALTLLIAFVRDSGHSVAETLVVRPGGDRRDVRNGPQDGRPPAASPRCVNTVRDTSVTRRNVVERMKSSAHTRFSAGAP